MVCTDSELAAFCEQAAGVLRERHLREPALHPKVLELRRNKRYSRLQQALREVAAELRTPVIWTPNTRLNATRAEEK